MGKGMYSVMIFNSHRTTFLLLTPKKTEGNFFPCHLFLRLICDKVHFSFRGD